MKENEYFEVKHLSDSIGVCHEKEDSFGAFVLHRPRPYLNSWLRKLYPWIHILIEL
jgi:hypothetical protein